MNRQVTTGVRSGRPFLVFGVHHICTASGGEEIVELVGGGPVDRLRQRSADVGRGTDRRVTEPALDDLERHAGLAHEMSGAVAEAMEGEAFEARPLDRRVVYALATELPDPDSR